MLYSAMNSSFHPGKDESEPIIGATRPEPQWSFRAGRFHAQTRGGSMCANLHAAAQCHHR
jgi:hypothetical protein